MSKSVRDITELGVKLGVRFRVDGVQPSQINKLLELLNAESDERLALVLVSLFSHRQASRGYMKQSSAREVSNAMQEVLVSRKSDLRSEARRVLGIAKWVYEALERKRIPPDRVEEIRDYDSLLRFLGES
ncbi:MAG: hypothetical protein QXO76_00480 [Thermoproteota archaeon]